MFSDANLFLKFKVNWLSNFLLKTGFDEKFSASKNWTLNFHFKKFHKWFAFEYLKSNQRIRYKIEMKIGIYINFQSKNAIENWMDELYTEAFKDFTKIFSNFDFSEDFFLKPKLFLAPNM